MLTVTKKFEFEAAHFLPGYEGVCKDMHGHTFKLEVEIGQEEDALDKEGMVYDFKKLEEIIQGEVVSHLDHKVLNNIVLVPTCENLVLWIRNKLFIVMNVLIGVSSVQRIRLYETSDSYVEWRR